MKISVALAAYNGEKYIAEQIISILKQLGNNDELIVSDDNPHGPVEEIIKSLNDNRIKYIEGPGKGVVANFQNALNNCNGDIIFLADQDDVWLDNKVDIILKEFDIGADLVLHNAEIRNADLSEKLGTCFELYNSNAAFIKNLIRNTFVGCCMAFTKDIKQAVLPIPGEVPMHDWWIALAAIKKGFKVSLVDIPLILWRRHDENVTGSKTTLADKIRFRIKMIGFLIPVCHGKDIR